MVDEVNKLVEEVLGVHGAAGGFGVELHAEEGQGFVLDPFDGVVVEVDEVGFPSFAEAGGVYCISMVPTSKAGWLCDRCPYFNL